MPFTKNDLVVCANNVNNALNTVMGEKIGNRYAVQSRNGYTALDEIVIRDGKASTNRTLATGTPRECQAELYVQAFWQLHEATRKTAPCQAPA